MSDDNRAGLLSRLLNSSIGAKIVMATTGGILVFFLLVHMLGNLQVYLGADTFNHYGQTLKGTPPLLWGTRITLLVSVFLHITAAIRLKKRSDAARPQPYAAPRRYRVSTPAARLMLLSGLVLLAFIVYHLLHFTLGVAHAEYFHFREIFQVSTQTWVRSENAEVIAKLPAHLVRHDIHSMFIRGFQVPAVAASYVVAQVLLGLHLSHAIASMLHTLGLSKGARVRARNEAAGRAVALVIVLGNLSFPIAVQAGLLHL